MIFKTFDSDIDKWTAKIGIFGKSFNELGTAINNAFEASINNIDNFDENIGFWETLKNNLAPKNENGDSWLKNSLGEIISAENINSYIEELDLDSAKNKLNEIFDWEATIKNGDATWQDYFDTLENGAEEYIPDLIKNTDDLSKLTGDDLVKANQNARQSALAQNAALKQQTLGAKAASAAMKGLTIAGNMFLGMAISWGVSKLVEGIDNLHDTEKELAEMRQEIIDAAETAKSEFDSIKSNIDSTTSTADELGQKYAELAQGVRNLGKANQSQGTLSNDEYQEFLDISNQLSDLFPTLIQGYDDNGNAILKLSGNVDTITESLNKFVSAEQALASIELKNQLRHIWGGYSVDIDNAKQSLSDAENDSRKLDEAYNKLVEVINRDDKSDSFYDIDSDVLTKILSDAGYNIGDFYSNDGVSAPVLDFNLSEEDIKELKTNIETAYSELTATHDKEINKATKAVESTTEKANKNIANYFLSSLQGDSAYADLEEEYKTVLNGLISNYDFSDKLGSNKIVNLVRFEEIKEELITKFTDLAQDKESQQLFQEYYNKLLSIDTEASFSENLPKIQEYINKLAELLGIESSKLQIALGYDVSGGYQKIDEAKDRFGYVKGNPSQLSTSQKERNKIIDEFFAPFEEEEYELLGTLEIPDYVYDNLEGELKNWWKEQQKFLDKNSLATHVELQTSADSMKSAFDDLNTALADYKENGLEGMDISNLTKLGDENTFGNINGSTAAYEKFLAVMHDVNATAEEVQDAFNELATVYVYNSGLQDKINEDNVEWIESQLEKINITNASAVAEQMLINKYGAEEVLISQCVKANLSLGGAKLTAENASEKLANATKEEANGLIEEAKAAGVADLALADYLISKIKSNDVSLTTDGDIANLLALCKGLDSAIDLIGQYQSIKNNIAQLEEDGAPEEAINSAKESAKNLLGAIETQIKLGAKANTNYKTSGGSSSSGGSSQDETDKTAETFDWIEVEIERLEEEINSLDKTVGNTYEKWGKRNTALTKEISKVKDEIDLQQKAYDAYIEKANSIGLSNEYKKKVQEGTLEIEDITDEALIEQINLYTEWWNKAKDCSLAIEDLNINLGDLASTRFDNVEKEFDDVISMIEALADIIDTQISRTETHGYFVDKSYYEELIKHEGSKIEGLQQEYLALTEARDSALVSGSIKKGSEEWNAMSLEILGVEQEIEDATNSIVEFNNAIRDIEWEIFDFIQEQISQITQEANFLIELLDNKSLFEDNGEFNERGLATVGLHGVNYNTYMEQAKDYADELTKINAKIADDPANKDLIERRNELLQLQQEAISNAEAEKDAIKSLVEEGINLHLEALSTLIDKYKESLNAAKDLYDYQKNIGEQTDNIANIEKIIMAYQGDDSEESRKIIQEKTNELNDAKSKLQETEWDRYISETSDVLDDLYLEYEEVLNARLDDIDGLISSMIDAINANHYDIKGTIESEANKVGYDVSNAISSAFAISLGVDGVFKTALTTFNDDFNGATTMLQGSIDEIKDSVKRMLVKSTDVVEEESKKNQIKDNVEEMKSAFNSVVSYNATVNSSSSNNKGTSTSTSNNSTSNNSSNSNNSSSTTSTKKGSGNGTPEIGDNVTLIAKQKFYASSDGSGTYGYGDKDTQVSITNIKTGAKYPYYITRKDGVKLGWANLSSLKGYAKGSYFIDKDQWALTQEEGNELIYTKDGAMLTRLNRGDMVFTNQMTKFLWNFAKAPDLLDNNQTYFPRINHNNKNIGLDISIGQIVANNPEEFTTQLKRHLSQDNNVQKLLYEVTWGKPLGRNSLRKHNY